mgnify:CR=1 FL=1
MQNLKMEIYWKNVRRHDVIASFVSADGTEVIGFGNGNGSQGIYRKRKNFKNVSIGI